MLKMVIIYHSETGNTRNMAELVAEGAGELVQVILMPVEDLNEDALREAAVVAFGSPTYYGTMSWQMKKCIDTLPVGMEGKLAGVFASAAWPGGGGYELTEINMIQGLLVRGMLVYSGGVVTGAPPTHFGAVSRKSPEGFDADRCRKLGLNLAKKGIELFGE
ncbi:MAG: flavodoxin family protein [bacterium]|jgi:NAD(P)H dehydrogenase (quinone)|nr:flavodoxin family protein [bacterium]MDD3804809.1 flavodoxin family protein [bacterium]MDD4152992.1 flavodoxin family protein [bacterium]MDD4558199.1 flavodoxin family protein [bacterium]